eukprot:CAMPEP_0113899350 /NCGR_PEP_ID=MMETSP0780_2-20120614/19970_1 /TAXON_ID=652834 /ORGANISM="Palpitomonas bilix" /LENGTH=83 /DNA_ID=CAMNT_0000891483 /DNA_START=13 /DNA_END=260 /DNA_ORIENTATION=+ /assembly_acc=CAM_ASM_000599
MKAAFVLLALVAVVANAATIPQQVIESRLSPAAIRDEFINEINSKASSWKAGRNDFFEGRTLAEVKKLLGAKKGSFPNIPVVS